MEPRSYIESQLAAICAEENGLPTPCSSAHSSPLEGDEEDSPVLLSRSRSKNSGRLLDNRYDADTPVLQFVSFTHPSQLQDITTKQAVRSHVTRRQHQRKRRKSTQGVQSKITKASLRPRQREAASHQQQRGKDQCSQDELKRDSTLLSQSHRERRHSRDGPPFHEASGMVPYSRLLESTFRSDSSIDSADNIPPQDLSTAKVFLVLNLNISGATCVQGIHIDTRSILDDYLSMSQLQASSIDRRNDSLAETSLGYLCTVTPCDAAPLSAAILLAATHLRWLHGATLPRPEQLRLREAALQTLNAGLETSEDRISDSLIIAVVIMAMYEMIHGQKEFYNAHMQGLVQMIHVRGGLAKLGLSGLFQRLVLLFDTKASSYIATASNMPGRC